MARSAPTGRGSRMFGALGRWIVRHPWRPIIFWIVLLCVAVPFLPLLGSVTTSSTTTLSSSAPSARAAAEMARLFPNQSSGSATYLLFTAGNMTDAHAQAVLLSVSASLESDGALHQVSGIASVYSEYAGYLAGAVTLARGTIADRLPTLLPSINASADTLWDPPARYLGIWEGLVANGSAPRAANYPAYLRTQSALSGNASQEEVLSAFYSGYHDSGSGFNGTNGTGGCAGVASTDVVACTDSAARTNEAPLLPSLFPSALVPASAALGTLGTENYTTYASVRGAVAVALAPALGLPVAWIATSWNAFPAGTPGPAAANAWANATVANATLASEPLPVPYAIRASYVDPSGTAQLIVVSFAVSDTATGAGGTNIVYSDLNEIGRRVGSTLDAADPSREISYVQTGGPALDQAESTVVNSSLALVLPVTVALLLAITALYFRSPISPLAAFAGISIALVLGLAGTVLLGTLVTHVDSTSFVLEEVFVLGIGTDYAIFLMARYREELVGGRTSAEAVERSVTWAGQSIATSGATAAIATLALSFSGVALLSQWGMVLSLAIVTTVLLSLTMTPAVISLVGPKIFWPSTGERFLRAAARRRARLAAEKTYFYRAGRLTQRRAGAVVLLLLLVSVPLIAIALTVPISYDFYDQLPSSQPAVSGLAQLGSSFGPGYAFPSTALVTFASPLVVGNATNPTEFSDIAALTGIAANVSGIASVESIVGPYGGSLSQWENLALQPAAVQAQLRSLLPQYVGLDDRTVLFVLETSASGLSASAIQTIDAVASQFSSFSTTHPEIASSAYSGAAPTTRDLAAQTFEATEIMIAAVAIGLILVLFIVLRSWIIPLLAVATIGLSISWAWALTYLALGRLGGLALYFFVPTLLFILILGLGIDYNIFLLTRVREERLNGRASSDATVEAVARTGGIITAAAIILASAFASLTLGSFVLVAAIGFSVAVAVILDAMIVRTYLVPSALHLLGERVWSLSGRTPRPARGPDEPPTP